MGVRRRIAIVFGVALALCAPAHAAGPPRTAADAGELHGLKLGLAARAMTEDGFTDLACGSNGGPPRQPLDAWAEFAKCPPEASGLHEVTARFGRAIDDPLYASQRTDTRVAGHPVILSVLFDDEGVLRGIRLVSDPRGSPIERRMAHLLRLAVINRYDPNGWTCTDFPPTDGETLVGGVFVKQRCDKTTAERHLIVEARLLRKPGQSVIDPATGDYRPGQFESWTRFELLDANYRKP